MTLLALPDVMDKASLPALATAIGAALRAGSPVSVDGAAAGRVGLSAVQLLASARRTALELGTEFTISQPSAELVAAISYAGLGASFGLADNQGAAA